MPTPSMADAPFHVAPTEDQIQRAVFQHIRTRAARGVFAFHPKNGGSHQRGRRAGINTGLGVVAGVPDVIILRDGHCYALELKTHKGKVSEAQVMTMVAMRASGATTAVVHGLDAALDQLEAWGILRGTTA